MKGIKQVLVFTLGEEKYCVPIDCIAEIVGSKKIRPIPNTEPHIEGVTDLRGETTTIVNPSKLLSIETESLVTDGGQAKNRIIVLDADNLNVNSPTGWLVSDVREVNKISESDIDAEGTTDSKFLRGLVKNDTDDTFTLWLNPDKIVA